MLSFGSCLINYENLGKRCGTNSFYFLSGVATLINYIKIHHWAEFILLQIDHCLILMDSSIFFISEQLKVLLLYRFSYL